MKALRIRRSVGRLGLARVAAGFGTGVAVKAGPLDYTTVTVPDLPENPGWHRARTRLAGICGSDLSMLEGHVSPYFEHWVSFPFVPGHEVVAERDGGRRFVLEPVLGHEARGLAPPYPGAAPGDGDDYAHLVSGSIDPGIQTGFCCSTGGGWAPELIVHESQIHDLADDVPDERAVLIEPLAGGIHGALMAGRFLDGATDPVVAVIGAGTIGLAAVAGLARYVGSAQIIVGGRYPHQRREAMRIGAHEAVAPDELARAVRRATGGHIVGDQLTRGALVTIDAVGAQATVTDALAMTRPRGHTILLGMPGRIELDLTGVWHREVTLVGAYAYGTETMADGSTARTFALAADTADAIGAESWLSATYRLDEYADAIGHAATAGPRGSVKIAFDLRNHTGSN